EAQDRDVVTLYNGVKLTKGQRALQESNARADLAIHNAAAIAAKASADSVTAVNEKINGQDPVEKPQSK
ncbi:hypothetical protein LTR53_020544, partial [Teratosphaeriaceae sp. CCFEE 6253]